MQSIRRVGGIAALLLTVLGVSACGGTEEGVGGTFLVEPESRMRLVVSGTQRTVLELEAREGSTVEMQVDDGETRDFAAGNSYRKAFTGALTIVFVHEGERPTTIHYEATSPAGVSVKVTPDEEEPDEEEGE